MLPKSAAPANVNIWCRINDCVLTIQVIDFMQRTAQASV